MTNSLSEVLQDLRFAARSLRRQAGLTTLVVLTLGSGIGATTALFAVVKSALLTPLPYGRPESVAVLWSAWKGFDRTWLSYDEYEAWNAEIPGIEAAGIFFDEAANLTGGDQPERVRSARIDASVIPILGVTPALGRNFSGDEDRPGGPTAAILSQEIWQRRYGADPALVGRTIQVNGEAVPVVGIMPPGFKLPMDFGADGQTHLYRPLAIDAAGEGAVAGPAFTQGGGNHGFFGVARLRPGTTVATVNDQLRRYVAKLTADNVYPPQMQFRAFALGIEDQITGPIKGPLLVLLGAVAIVLLIACANVAGLLLVRAEKRRRELAVRTALGAGAGRLARLLFAETGLLATLGAIVGATIAWGGIAAVRQLAPASLPRVGDTTIEPPLLAFALVVASLTAVLTGVLPALHATKVAPADELKEGGRGATAGGRRLRGREALVTVEIALAVVLAVGAGLLIRSVGNLLSIDPGFSTRGILSMRISTPSTWYQDSARVATFWNEVEHRVGSLPLVRSVGAVRLLPLATEMGDWGLRVEGYTPPPHQGTPSDWQIVTPGYFATLGLRLREGRVLESRDDLTGLLAMVVNRRFTELYLRDRSALGATVRIGGDPNRPAYTIVGVVDDVKHNALTSQVKAQFYVTLAQFARSPGNTVRSMSLVVHTDADPRALITPVRAAIRAIDARLPVAEVRTLDEIVAASIAAPRFAMQLLGAFGVIALLLSAIGVFGVVSHAMAMRHHEFGIRAALGARPAELLRLGLGAGLRQTVAGLGLGVIGALLTTRFLRQLLEGTSPTDPVTFLAVVLLTGAAGLLACAVPGYRASRAAPAAIMRDDR